MNNSLCYGCMVQDPQTPCAVCGFDHQLTDQASFNIKPGTTLNGDAYLVGNPLGQGGFGITYIGWDTKLDIKLAIKEFFPQTAAGRTSAGITVAPFSGEKGEDFS